MTERRQHVLSNDDIDRIILVILQDENIDKFAAKFEERWRNYFYRGLGKGIVGYAYRGLIYVLFVLAGYGMAKDWKFWH